VTNPLSGATAVGNFQFTVTLQAERSGNDFDGRQYTILVSATDAAGNTGTASAVVTVPHDQGHQSVGMPGGGFEGGTGVVRGPVGMFRHGLGHRIVLGNVGMFRPVVGNPIFLGNGHGHGNHLVFGGGEGNDQGNDQGNGHGNGHGHGHGG
jgi:hypothetical protein